MAMTSRQRDISGEYISMYLYKYTVSQVAERETRYYRGKLIL